MGIERAASKEALTHFNRWHFSAAIIYFHHEVFRIRFLIDIYFDEVHSAILQKFLGTAAIHAPARAIHRDLFHTIFDFSGVNSDSVTFNDPRMRKKQQEMRPLSQQPAAAPGLVRATLPRVSSPRSGRSAWPFFSGHDRGHLPLEPR